MLSLIHLKKELFSKENWHFPPKEGLKLHFSEHTVIVENTSQKASYLSFRESGDFSSSLGLIETSFLRDFKVVYEGFSNLETSCPLYLVEYSQNKKTMLNKFDLNSRKHLTIQPKTSCVRIALKIMPKEICIITDFSFKHKNYDKVSSYLLENYKTSKEKPFTQTYHDFFQEKSWVSRSQNSSRILLRKSLIISHKEKDTLSYKQKLPVTTYDNYALFFLSASYTKGHLPELIISQYEKEKPLSSTKYPSGTNKKITFSKKCSHIEIKLLVKKKGLSEIKNLKILSPLRNTIKVLTAERTRSYPSPIFC